MTESSPGHAETHAGEVGARRRPIGVHATDEDTSINLPPNTVDEVVPEPVADEISAEETPEPFNTMGVAEPDESGLVARAPMTEQERVRQDIGRTRREMGETVEALARKADVRARAHDKAEEAKARLGRQVHRTRTATLEKAAALTTRLREAAPDPVRDAAGRAVARTRGRPAAGSVAAGAVLLLVLWRLLRGRTGRRSGTRR